MCAEYVQIVGIQVGGVDKLLAGIEAGRIVIQRGQLLPVHLCSLFLIVFAAKQVVVVLYQKDEWQQGDECDSCQYRPTFLPEVDNPCDSCHEQQQP